jgi:hypothetical protein
MAAVVLSGKLLFPRSQCQYCLDGSGNKKEPGAGSLLTTSVGVWFNSLYPEALIEWHSAAVLRVP